MSAGKELNEVYALEGGKDAENKLTNEQINTTATLTLRFGFLNDRKLSPLPSRGSKPSDSTHGQGKAASLVAARLNSSASNRLN